METDHQTAARPEPPPPAPGTPLERNLRVLPPHSGRFERFSGAVKAAFSPEPQPGNPSSKARASTVPGTRRLDPRPATLTVGRASTPLERYRQSWRKARIKARSAQIPLALAPLAKRFEITLAKRGVTISPGQPWSESLPPDWTRETRWVALYNRLRFARGDDEDLGELARELEELEKEKAKN